VNLYHKIKSILGRPFPDGQSGNMMLGAMLVSGVVLLGLGALHQKGVLLKATVSVSKTETYLDKAARTALESIQVFNHNYRTIEGKRWIQITDDGQGLTLSGTRPEVPAFIRDNIGISGYSITHFVFVYCDLAKMTSVDTEVFGFSSKSESDFSCTGKQVVVYVNLKRANPSTGDVVLEAAAQSNSSGQTKKISAKFNFPMNLVTMADPQIVKALNGFINMEGKGRFCVDYSNGVMEVISLSSRLGDQDFFAIYDITMNSGTVRHTKGVQTAWGLRTQQLPGDWRFVKAAFPHLDSVYDCSTGGEQGLYRTRPTITKTVSGTKTCFEIDDSSSSQSGRACHKFYWNLQVSE